MTEVHFDLFDPDAVHFCPQCGAGYTANTHSNVSIAAPDLVPRSWIEAQEREKQKEREASSRETVVHLCRLNNRLLASLLEAALDEAGVAFSITDAGIQAGLRQQGLSGHFEFVVVEKDFEKARSILLQLEEDTREEPGLHDE